MLVFFNIDLAALLFDSSFANRYLQSGLLILYLSLRGIGRSTFSKEESRHFER